MQKVRCLTKEYLAKIAHSISPYSRSIHGVSTIDGYSWFSTLIIPSGEGLSGEDSIAILFPWCKPANPQKPEGSVAIFSNHPCPNEDVANLAQMLANAMRENHR